MVNSNIHSRRIQIFSHCQFKHSLTTISNIHSRWIQILAYYQFKYSLTTNSNILSHRIQIFSQAEFKFKYSDEYFKTYQGFESFMQNEPNIRIFNAKWTKYFNLFENESSIWILCKMNKIIEFVRIWIQIFRLIFQNIPRIRIFYAKWNKYLNLLENESSIWISNAKWTK